MKKLNTPILVSGLMLAALSGNTFGQAGISFGANGANPADVSANVNFKITIPKIMILRVGDWGNKNNTVAWTQAFGITNFNDRAANETHWTKTGTAGALSTATDDEAESDKAGDGILKVAAFGNVGSDLYLSANSTEFTATTGGGATQPSLVEITAAHAGGTAGITHPTLVASGSSAAVPLAHINGVVRLEDTWAYNYAPTGGVVPVGGVYDGSVTYTLSAAP